MCGKRNMKADTDTLLVGLPFTPPFCNETLHSRYSSDCPERGGSNNNKKREVVFGKKKFKVDKTLLYNLVGVPEIRTQKIERFK